MISICTINNKIIPWLNLRIINICSQSFQDWEWIVVDNSADGCVKKYFDDFFTTMQGVYYPECRAKIKVYHEPFTGVGIGDGRIGKLKNRSVQLATCRSDEFCVILDSDDFLIDGFLNTLDKITKQYQDVEFVTGDGVNELCQNIDDGVFFNDNFVSDKFLTKPYDNHIDDISVYGCNKMDGFAEYCEYYLNSHHKISDKYPIDIVLDFPYTDVRFDLTRANTIHMPFFYLSTYRHPYAFRKRAFFTKLGGFCEYLPNEDIVNIRVPYLLKTVYIKKPCIVQVPMLSDYSLRFSCTCDVDNVLSSGEFRDIHHEYIRNCCWERYKLLGWNMMNPIPFEVYSC